MRSVSKSSAVEGILKSTLLLAVLLVTMVGCDGTRIPGELRGSPQIPDEAVDLDAPLNVEVSGFVGGSAGSSGASSEAQVSRATVTGETIPGANGVDLKDLGWNNLYVDGLATSAFPPEVTPVVNLYVEGEEDPVATINQFENGNFTQSFDAPELRRGGRIVLEMVIGDNTSQINLPILALDDGDRMGFNAIRRDNGTLVVELFIDAQNNETLELVADGKADNNIRIVVDNGSDINGDGLADTVARMDTSDGMSFFDLDLDGRFGDPVNDGVPFIDTDGDGFSETAIVVAVDSDVQTATSSETVSFLIDPELDGIRLPNAERDLGERTAADLVSTLVIEMTPEVVAANGVNTATVNITVKASNDGLPVDARILLSLSTLGSEGLETELAERFLLNSSREATRLVSPSDPEVRLLSNGDMLLSETAVVPQINPDLVDQSTRLSVSVRVDGSEDDPLTISTTLIPTEAPIVTSVLFGGRNNIAGESGGLETLSRKARLVWGDPVQVNGENFAADAAANEVSVGGVLATDVQVTGTTQLNFTIPEGAETGLVSVTVEGFGGTTSENIVIAGAPFEVNLISPESGSTIASNTEFSLQMTRAVDADSLTSDSAFLREVGTTTNLGWDVALDAGDTIHISQGSGTALEDGKDYEIVFTSELLADGEDPVLVFDANPSATQTNGLPIESAVVATFSAIVPDVTAPTITSTSPAEGATDVASDTTLSVQFSEAMSLTSLARAASNGNIFLQNDETQEYEEIRIEVNAAGDTFTILPKRYLAGNTLYRLRLPANTGNNLTDQAGNAFTPSGADPDWQDLTFTTAMSITAIFPRNGPIGTEVTLRGGKFGTDTSAISVTVGGVAVTSVTAATDSAMAFVVPEGAQDGAVVVTVGDESATSPLPFAITLDREAVNLPGLSGSGPAALAVSPDDSRVFVANQGDGTISVYDLNTMEPIDTDGNSENGVNPLRVGQVPSEVQFSRDGRYLLSLDFGSPTRPSSSFVVINAQAISRLASGDVSLTTNETYNIVSNVQVGRRPTRIATGPSGQRWYVTNFLDDTISVVRAQPPFDVIATIDTGLGPNGITISADGRRGYVCNYIEGTVSVFSTTSYEELGRIQVGLNPARAVLSPDGRYVVVSCYGDPSLHVIDTEAKANVFQLRTSFAQPATMLFNGDGSQLYVASRAQNVVTIYDFNQVDAPLIAAGPGNLETGRIPSAIALTNDSSRLIAANQGQGSISVIALAPPVQTIAAIIPVGRPSISAGSVPDPNFDPNSNEDPVVTVPGPSTTTPPSVTVRGDASTTSTVRNEPVVPVTTNFSDVGETLVIRGSGFPVNLANVEVLFSAKPSTETVGIQSLALSDRVSALILAEFSNADQITAVVPDNAISGPVVVRINNVDSAPVEFVITPDRPKVVRTTPTRGAVGFDGSDPIIVRFNEPVFATSEDFQLVRLLDTFTNGVRDVDATSIGGTISFRDFNQEVHFTPDQPLEALANSNNLFRFTVNDSVTDLAGKALERELTFEFRLQDSRGPTLLKATFIDIDNNGVDQDDVVYLLFDEEIIGSDTTTFPAEIGATGADVTLDTDPVLTAAAAQGDSTLAAPSFGTGARIEKPALTELENSAARFNLDSLARTLVVRLGESPQFLVPGARTGIVGITNRASVPFVDRGGNTSFNLITPEVDIGYIFNRVETPVALSAILVDEDLNGTLDAGDHIGIYCNVALNFLDLPDISVFTAEGGASFGTGATVTPYADNGRVAIIWPGTSPNFDFNNPDHKISAAAAITDILNFTGTPLQPFASTDINYSIGAPTTGPQIDETVANPVVLFDPDRNGPDIGDWIEVRFNRDLTVGEAPAEAVFTLAVSGDNFGLGASVRPSQNETLTREERARTVEIVLGANPALLPRGTYSATATGFPRASGLDINPNIPRWTVADAFGNSAQPNVAGPFDLASDDTTSPLLAYANLADVNNDGLIGAGDTITMAFDEPVLRNRVGPADLFLRIGESSIQFDAASTITRGTSLPVNGALIERNSLILTIAGTDAIDPIELLPAPELVLSSAPISDISGNLAVDGDDVTLILPINELTLMQRAVLLDNDGNGIDQGDSLYVQFSGPVALSGASINAEEAFALYNPLDTFGSSATVVVPTVTQAMVDGGVTNFAVGTVDPSLVEIQLGFGASFADVRGRFTGTDRSYSFGTFSTGVGDSLSPSGLLVAYPYSVGFAASDLAAGFNNSANFGRADAFEGIQFDSDGDGSGDFTFGFRLPGGRSALDPTSSTDIGRVAAGLNSVFRSQGSRLRAFYNAAFNELVIVDNGSNELSFSSVGESFTREFLANVNSDLQVTVSGRENFGSVGALTNRLGIQPNGGADIEYAIDRVPPTIVSAKYNPEANRILVEFSEAVEVTTDAIAAQGFALPVDGDRFGLGARLVRGNAPNQVFITLGSGSNITANGDFLSTVLAAGSPSGLAPAVPSLTRAPAIRDIGGNAPTGAAVDIELDALIVDASLVGAAPASIDLNGIRAQIMSFQVSISDPLEEFLFNSFTFSPSGNGTGAVVSAALIEDSDFDGQVSASDRPAGEVSINRSNGSMTFTLQPHVMGGFSGAPTLANFLLLLELAPDSGFSGQTVGFDLVNIDASAASLKTVVVVAPTLSSGNANLIASDALAPTAAEALAAFRHPAGVGRKNHGAASTRAYFNGNRGFVITSAQMAMISESGTGVVSGEIQNLGFTWNFQSESADLVLNTDTGGAFTGMVDTTAERQAFAEALQDAFDTQFGRQASRLTFNLDRNENLVVRESEGDFFNFSPFLSVDDLSTFQNLFSVPIASSGLNVDDDDNEVLFFFGGIDASNNYLNDVVVFAAELDGPPRVLENVRVLADPDDGMPAGREGMAFAMTDLGEIIMHGGRDGSTVYSDTWRLIPEWDVDDGDSIELILMRWEKLSSSGPARAFATSDFVAASRSGLYRTLILSGGLDDVGAATSSVYTYQVETNTWTNVNLGTSASNTQARWGAGGGWIDLFDAYVEYGGANDSAGASALDSAQIFQFTDAANATATSPTQFGANNRWPGAIQPAILTAGEEDGMLVFTGGHDGTGASPDGLGIMYIDGANSVRWLPRQSGSQVPLGLKGRIGATLSDSEDGAYLAFGEDGSGLVDSVDEIFAQLATGEAFDRDGPMLAVINPSAGSSNTHDTGDTLEVIFSWSTNLGSLYSGSLTDVQLNEHFELRSNDGFSSGIPFPTGSTGDVSTTFLPNDTLTITFGAAVADLDSAGSLDLVFSMAPNQFASSGVRRRGGERMSGGIPISGTTDQDRFYTWTGANSSDFHDPGNWSVAGAAATLEPDSDDIVYIKRSNRPCVVPSGYQPQVLTGIDNPTPNLDLNQLIVAGGEFHSLRGVSLWPSDSFADPNHNYSPMVMQAYGLISMPDFYNPWLRVTSSGAYSGYAFFTGNNSIANFDAGFDTFAAGLLHASGNISGTSLSDFFFTIDDGLNFFDQRYLFQMRAVGDQPAAFTVSDAFIDGIMVAKASGVGFDINSGGFQELQLLDLVSGTMQMTGGSTFVSEEMLCLPNTTTDIGSAATIELIDGAEGIFFGQTISNLSVSGTNFVSGGDFATNSGDFTWDRGWSHDASNGLTGDGCMATTTDSATSPAVLTSPTLFLPSNRETLLGVWFRRLDAGAGGRITLRLVSSDGFGNSYTMREESVDLSFDFQQVGSLSHDSSDFIDSGDTAWRAIWFDHWAHDEFDGGSSSLHLEVEVSSENSVTTLVDRVFAIPTSFIYGDLDITGKLDVSDAALSCYQEAGQSINFDDTLLTGPVVIGVESAGTFSMSGTALPAGVALVAEGYGETNLTPLTISALPTESNAFMQFRRLHLTQGSGSKLTLNPLSVLDMGIARVTNTQFAINEGAIALQRVDFDGTPANGVHSGSPTYISVVPTALFSDAAARIGEFGDVRFADSATVSVEVDPNGDYPEPLVFVFAADAGTGFLTDTSEWDATGLNYIDWITNFASFDVTPTFADSPFIDASAGQVIGQMTFASRTGSISVDEVALVLDPENFDPNAADTWGNFMLYKEDGTTFGYQPAEDTLLATAANWSYITNLSLNNSPVTVADGDVWGVTADIGTAMQPGSSFDVSIGRFFSTGGELVPFYGRNTDGAFDPDLGQDFDVLDLGFYLVGDPSVPSIFGADFSERFQDRAFGGDHFFLDAINLNPNSNITVEILDGMGGVVTGLSVNTDGAYIASDGRSVRNLQLPFDLSLLSTFNVELRVTYDDGVVTRTFEILHDLPIDGNSGGGGGPGPAGLSTQDDFFNVETTQNFWYQVHAFGGQEPYSFSTPDSPPTGLSLSPNFSSDGVIVGAVDSSALGTYFMTVTVTDSNFDEVTANLEWNVSQTFRTQLEFLPIMMPAGQVNRPYQAPVFVAGGVAPYGFSIQPTDPVFSIDASTGLITGTPLTAGIYQLTVEVNDSSVGFTQTTIDIPVVEEVLDPIQIVTVGEPPANEGTPYFVQFSATGGAAGSIFGNPSLIRWRMENEGTDNTSAMTFPQLDSDGTLEWVPEQGTAGFSYWADIVASDGFGNEVSRTFTIMVNQTFQADPLDLTLLSAGTNHTLAATLDGNHWAWGSNSAGQLAAGSTVGVDQGQAVEYGIVTNEEIADVAAGDSHSLALTRGGKIKAAGSNADGQLGFGNNTDQNMYGSDVPGIDNVIAIAAGGNHSLALRSDGTVWAWGDNAYGQLGNGHTGTDSLSPMQVPLLHNIIGIAAGANHSLAVDRDGRVWSWGRNNVGQLGMDDFEQFIDQSMPVDIAIYDHDDNNFDPVKLVSVAAGGNTSYAVGERGIAFAWGENTSGQLGYTVHPHSPPTIGNRDRPHQVANLTEVMSIHAGNGFAMALTGGDAGHLWMWGSNSDGQLGDTFGIGDEFILPFIFDQTSMGDAGVFMAAAGGKHSVVMNGLGEVYAWGDNTNGQLGNGGSPTGSTSPVQVQDIISPNNPITLFGNVTITMNGAEIVDIDNTSLSGGSDNVAYSQTLTASGSSATPYTYSAVGLPSGLSLSNSTGAISGTPATGTAGAHNVRFFVVDNNGVAAPRNLVLGIGHSFVVPFYQPVPLSAGLSHTLAAPNNGDMQVWGDNSKGQMGVGSSFANSDIPESISSFNPSAFNGDAVLEASAGSDHSIVLSSGGDIWTFGDNTEGAVDPANLSSTTIYDPHQMNGSSTLLANVGPFVSVSGGEGFSLAVDHNGNVWAWGSNLSGKLGIGNTGITVGGPYQVAGLSNIVQVSAGIDYCLALRYDGSVWAWGDNEFGQLGNGTGGSAGDHSAMPVMVSNLSKVLQIAAGGNHAIALAEDATNITSTWTWGDNSSTELGRGSANAFENTPGQLPSFLSTGSFVAYVAAGEGFSAAIEGNVITPADNLYTWGKNNLGQLGLGSIVNQSAPTLVTNLIGQVGTVACGASHIVIGKIDGSLVSAGNNSIGQLGAGAVGSLSSSPVSVSSLNIDSNVTNPVYQDLVSDGTNDTLGMPEGTLGQAYTAIFSAVNGSPTYFWQSPNSFTMPEGLTFSSIGEVTGTPGEKTIRMMAVIVLDSNGTHFWRVYPMIIQ